MPVVKDVELGDEALKDLAGYLIEKFAQVVEARHTQVDDNALRWQENYDALPAEKLKTFPFVRAANFVPNLIRMHCDILGARILGFFFATKPFWRIRSLMRDAIDHTTLEDLAEGLNYLWDVELRGFEFVDEIVNGSLQTGTLILKGVWDDTTKGYLSPIGEHREQSNAELSYDTIPFEDFWPYPITARNSIATEIMFHRIRLTERDVEYRKSDKGWSAKAADLLMKKSEPEPLAEQRAQSAGINLTADVSYPYTVIECWLDWRIAGKKRPIVVVLNPAIAGKDAILRCYYNFMPYGERPFIDFKPMPRKGSFFGYAGPEILEQAQEEQAQIHNARRDANVIANTPTWKKKRYADVPNPATDWYPGAIIELDEMDDMEMLSMQTNYNAMIDEEQFLMSLAERYLGISPSMQGFGAGQAAGKRGIYSTGGTLALLSEGNRRLDIYLRRLRYPFHRAGRLTVQSYNYFAPDFFKKFGAKGESIQRAFQLADNQGKLLFDPCASDAGSNREIDRQNLLQMANVMAVYYQRIIELTQVLQQLGPDTPMGKMALAVLDGARDLAARILFAFDQGDRDRLLPDVRKELGGGGGGAPVAQPGPGPTPEGVIQPGQLETVLSSIAAVSR